MVMMKKLRQLHKYRGRSFSRSDQRSLLQERFLFGSDSVSQIKTPAQKYAGVLILVSVIVAATNSISNS